MGVLVNLVPSKARFSQSNLRRRMILKKVCGGLGIFLSVLGVVFLVLGWWRKTGTEGMEKRLAQRKSQLTGFDEGVRAGQDLLYRLKLLAGILEDRSLFGEALQEFSQFVPSGAEIDQIDFESDKEVKAKILLSSQDQVDWLEKKAEDFYLKKAGERGFFDEFKLGNAVWRSGIWFIEVEAKR